MRASHLIGVKTVALENDHAPLLAKRIDLGEGDVGGVSCKKGESILLPAGLTDVAVSGKGFEIITSSAK